MIHEKFKNTTFSFHNSEPISSELIESFQRFKMHLEPELPRLNLPKEVIIDFWNEDLMNSIHKRNLIAVNFHCYQFKEFKNLIVFNTDRLHEIEVNSNRTDFHSKLLCYLVHELAHFKFKDEKKTRLLARNTLKHILEKMKEVKTCTK